MIEIFVDLAGEISIRDGVARITFVGDDPQGTDGTMTPKLRVILPIKGLFDLHNAIGDLAKSLEAARSAGTGTAGSASQPAGAFPAAPDPSLVSTPRAGPSPMPDSATPADAAGRSPNFA